MSDRRLEAAATPPHGPGRLAFGAFRFDMANGILSRDGLEIQLAPRPLDVLRCLLKRPGDVVSKQELLDEVWSDAVVEEATLLEAVGVVRKALGDDSRRPTYIQTLHRRGYRFIADVSSATVARPGLEDAAPVEALSADSPPGEAPSEDAPLEDPAPPPGRTMVVSLALIAAIAWAAALVITELRAPRDESPRLTIQHFVDALPPNHRLLQRASSMSISRDGTQIVYVSASGFDNASLDSPLLTRPIDRPEWTVLPGTENGWSPTLSPDGEWIAFWKRPREGGLLAERGELWRISVNGGQPQLLGETHPDSRQMLQWEPDGYVYFTGLWGRLLRIPENGGAAEIVIDLDGRFRGGEELSADDLDSIDANSIERVWVFPQVLADGEYLLVGERRARRLLLFSTASGEASTLLEGVSWARYVSTAHLIYRKRSSLWARPFDIESLQLGEPEVKLSQYDGDFHFSETGTGTLVYYNLDEAWKNEVVWIDRQGEMTTALDLGSNDCANPDLSTDGEKLLLACGDTRDQGGIYLAHLSRQMITPLVLEGNNWTPIWNPGEQAITYSSNREEGWGIYQVSYDGLDGFGVPELLLKRQNPIYPQVWSPDGRWLAFMERHPETKDDIWLLPVDPPGEPIPFIRTPAEERVATLVSPDGRWLGYATHASGEYHTYLASVPGAEVQKKISSLAGGFNVWVPQREEVLYLTQAGETLLSVKFPDGAHGEPATPRILFDFDVDNLLQRRAIGMVFDVAPDGERIISVVWRPSTASRLHIVVNWFEELKQRVPTGR